MLGIPERPHDAVMTTEYTNQNKQLVNDFIQDLFTKGDLDAVKHYLDPNFVNHDAPFPGAPDGAEGMRWAAEKVRAALPDWHSEPQVLIAEDDIVVEVFTASGTHTGDLFGVSGSGKTLTLHGINVFRIDNGRIVERWARLDHMGLLQQLGMAPALD
jgi:steroid delta-isomerase-like uncharacterized protein